MRGFDLVGITLPYELSYSNVLETLDLAGIPLRAADRGEDDPLVVGGGPCAFNPEPVAPFFDAILIGEGEEAVAEIVHAHRSAKARGCSRAETLLTLSQVAGVYVPSLYVERRSGGAFLGVDPLEGAPGRGGQARRCRPGRLLAADLRCRPVHGRRPRPFRHRGAARLHARMSLLSGGDGVPAGA